jgi:hypothetical protein
MVEEGKESAQVAMHEVDKVDEQSVELDAEENKHLDAVRLVLATAHLLNGERNEELLQFLHGGVDCIDKRPEIPEERERRAYVGATA